MNSEKENVPIDGAALTSSRLVTRECGQLTRVLFTTQRAGE